MSDRLVNEHPCVSPRRLAAALRHCIVCFVIAGAGATATAEELVAEFTGTGNRITDEFEIDAPWLLDWHVTSDYAESLGIEVDLIDAVFLTHKGQVFVSRYPGGGTKMFNESGRFRFRIMASTTNWRLRVSKITEEEAARMIPKNKQ